MHSRLRAGFPWPRLFLTESDGRSMRQRRQGDPVGPSSDSEGSSPKHSL